jgi:hypothetical protein
MMNMSTRQRTLVAIGCIAALLPQMARAGAWAQELGKLYAKITYGSSSANTVYRFDGNTKYPTDNGPATVRDYPLADRSIFLYAEYGVSERLTLIGNLAMKRSIITTPVERKQTQGLSDIGIAAKYRLAQFDQQVISATLGVTVPTGYSRDLTPPLGSGNLNIELIGNYGISLYPLPAYATGSIGYRLRPSIFLSKLSDPSKKFQPDYADEVFSDLEAGYTFFDRLLIHGMARFLFSTRMDDNDFDVEHPPETQQWIKVGGGAIVKVHDGFELNADAFVTPYGKKAANSFDLLLGISYSGNLLPQ